MTDAEEKQIVQYQAAGYGYRRIANFMELPLYTVKSYCTRHPLEKQKIKSSEGFCLSCGKLLVNIPHKRKKKFCCDACRLSWWAKHPEDMNRSAFYTFECATCGKEFKSYGNANRKYCSQECYHKAARVGYDRKSK